jgi:hypothetical protein
MALPAERILHSIHLFRKERVLLDADLATLYGVETRVLIQAVKRNSQRFPADFMFQLSEDEWANLKSHSVISSSWGDLPRCMRIPERKYDGQFRVVFEALRDLMEPPLPAKKPIGFRPKK